MTPFFPANTISKGTIVEQCPVITVKLQEMVARQHLLLNYYAFMIDESQELASLALGYGSLYNHADHHNTTYSYDTDKNLMVFETLNPIAKHQELTINYLSPDSKGQTIDYWAQKPDIASL